MGLDNEDSNVRNSCITRRYMGLIIVFNLQKPDLLSITEVVLGDRGL